MYKSPVLTILLALVAVTPALSQTCRGRFTGIVSCSGRGLAFDCDKAEMKSVPECPSGQQVGNVDVSNNSCGTAQACDIVVCFLGQFLLVL